eukprot:7940-Eustigmatos_ZCMA.PRE.1
MARHQTQGPYRLAAAVLLLGGLWPSPVNSFLPVVPSTTVNREYSYAFPSSPVLSCLSLMLAHSSTKSP